MATVFEALLLSLPTRSSTIRMRVWRALKSTGCAVLRDGVYILPKGAPRAAVLAEVESEVQSTSGFAMTVELNVAPPAKLQHIRSLFDRSAEYGALVKKMNDATAILRRLGSRKGETMVGRMRRSFEELSAIDFYPNHAQAQARETLTALEQELREVSAHGEPRSSKTRVRRLDAKKYTARKWATRKHPWVDRLACAWLIKRFIDKRATFVWLEHPRDRPKQAIGFDFDGAQFTHADNRVTYEVLLASFGLAHDPALATIGAAVHYLDIGGIPVPDAKGLESVLSGIRQKARTDDQMVREASRIFDLLYSAYENNGRASARAGPER